MIRPDKVDEVAKMVALLDEHRTYVDRVWVVPQKDWVPQQYWNKPLPPDRTTDFDKLRERAHAADHALDQLQDIIADNEAYLAATSDPKAFKGNEQQWADNQGKASADLTEALRQQQVWMAERQHVDALNLQYREEHTVRARMMVDDEYLKYSVHEIAKLTAELDAVTKAEKKWFLQNLPPEMKVLFGDPPPGSSVLLDPNSPAGQKEAAAEAAAVQKAHQHGDHAYKPASTLVNEFVRDAVHHRLRFRVDDRSLVGPQPPHKTSEAGQSYHRLAIRAAELMGHDPKGFYARVGHALGTTLQPAPPRPQLRRRDAAEVEYSEAVQRHDGLAAYVRATGAETRPEIQFALEVSNELMHLAHQPIAARTAGASI